MIGSYATSVMRSLEATTTYLYLKAADSGKGDIAQKAFVEHLSLIYDVLRDTTGYVRVGPASLLYRFLLGELNRASPRDAVTVVTFNYDLVVENVLNEITAHYDGVLHFPGCYRLETPFDMTGVRGAPAFRNKSLEHKGVALLKLHGSTSWQSKHVSEVPSQTALLRKDRPLTVLNSLQLRVSLTWRRKKRTMYLYPIVVPPISGKRGMMHVALEPIWKRAAQSIREATRIVLVGYSCPPLDLEARMLLAENMRVMPEKQLTVVDPSATSAARFQDICGTSMMTIYTSLKAFVERHK